MLDEFMEALPIIEEKVSEMSHEALVADLKAAELYVEILKKQLMKYDKDDK